MSYIITLLVFVFIAWLILRGLNKMLGEKKPFIVVSPFKSLITLNGEPVRNQEVYLHFCWNCGSSKDYDGYWQYLRTDNDGRIEIDAVQRKIFISNIQPSTVHYDIYISIERDLVCIASATKSGLESYTEWNGQPKNLSCELNNTSNLYSCKDNKDHVVTRCRWDGCKEIHLEY